MSARPAAAVAEIAVSPTRLIAPMLATLGDLPAGPGWGFEFKWDGVRAITYRDVDGVRVLSRNHRDVTDSYPELTELGMLLAGRDAVVDGEIVALDPAAGGGYVFGTCTIS